MEKCYSNVDIMDKLGHDTRVLIYHDLLNYDNIDDALGDNDAMVVLYEQKNNFGHWCAVYLEDGILYFFDPYGIFPDEQLEEIDEKFRLKSGQDYHYLSTLMALSPYEVDYNDYQFQNAVPGINTCGRWCVSRIANRNLTNDEFIELFGHSDESVDPDELVVEFTDSL